MKPEVLQRPSGSAKNADPRQCESAQASSRSTARSAGTIEAEGGAPLPADLQTEMERHFSHDFSRVRVHDGREAARSANAHSARAYTMGNRITFAENEYRPDTAGGKRLVAHELAHVVQQGRGGSNRTGPGHEAEAHVAADAASRGARADVKLGAARGIARHEPHNRGYAGEQEAGFVHYSQKEGWQIVEGPSGSGGHGVTTKGFDGIAYHPKNDELHIYDNKAFKKSTSTSSATAIDPAKNLEKNLDSAIDRLTKAKDLPNRIRVIELMKKGRDALKSGKSMPGNVKLVVTGSGGAVTSVSEALRKRGVIFKAEPTKDPIPVAPKTKPPANQPPPSAPKKSAGAKTPAAPMAEDAPAKKTAPRARGGSGAAVPTPAQTVTRMGMNVAAGVAVGLFQAAWKDRVTSDLQSLPRPNVDKRSGAEFLLDPDSHPGLKDINLMNRHFGSLGKQLEDHHGDRMAAIGADLLLTAVVETKKAKDFEKRIGRLEGMSDSLDDYETSLGIMEDNLDAVLDQEDALREFQESSRVVRTVISNAVMANELVKIGFSFEELEQLHGFLTGNINAIDNILKHAKSVNKKIAGLMTKSANMRRELEKAQKIEIDLQYRENLKEQRADDASRKEKKERYIEADAGNWTNAEQKKAYASLRDQEAQALVKLRKIEQQINDPTSSEKLRTMLKRQYQMVRDMLEKIRTKKQPLEMEQMRVPV
jgi:hypothetical protein